MSQEAEQSTDDDAPSSTESWPTFDLRYTFNPDRTVREKRFAPDEVFLFDPDHLEVGDSRWIAAERGSYVAIEDAR